MIWAIAGIGEWVSAKLIDDSGFVIEPGHFVERHGLVVLIAIGESVIAVGIGAAGLTVDTKLVVVALLGLALSGCLWWTHFGTDEGAAERAMATAPVPARPRLAINAFGYWHMVILLGIIAIAAALRTATGDAPRPAHRIAGGRPRRRSRAYSWSARPCFGRRSGSARSAPDRFAAAIALVTIPIGVHVEATAQLAVLVGVFVAMLAVEGTRTAAR